MVDVIQNIPELLLQVVPGYITLKLIEVYGTQKKKDNFNTLMLSILYSFVIGVVYSAVGHIFVFLVGFCNPRLSGKISFALQTILIKQCIYLILSVVLGLFLIKLPKLKFGKWIDRIFNKQQSSEPDVWSRAMQNDHGAWAIVYLKNGLIYTGQLIAYTSEPDVENKEILLSKFTLEVRNDAPNDNTVYNDYVYDYSTESNARVYLRIDDIDSIQIVP